VDYSKEIPSIKDYDFVLPKERIADTPCLKRDLSRLMVVTKDKNLDHQFIELPKLLKQYVGEGALLIFNDTKVLHARLYAYRLASPPNLSATFIPPNLEKEKPIEFLLLAYQERADYEDAHFCEKWSSLYRSKRPPIVGDFYFIPGQIPLFMRIEPPLPSGDFCISLFGTNPKGLVDSLSLVGEVPLPPYIERVTGPTKLDNDRYQTVFARNEGAIAAPTAGLHFSNELLATLNQQDFQQAFITLHVGFGTFAPVKTDLANHKMHFERYFIPKETALAINQAKKEGRKVIAVGTTVVRALESAIANQDGTIYPTAAETNLLIYPPYSFRFVDALITNFHLPKSTLLLLVSAFMGKNRCLAAYKEAILKEYRFFSYGDAMLIPCTMEDA